MKQLHRQNKHCPWRLRLRRTRSHGGSRGGPVTIGACTMPVGAYYVGDLTYVLDTMAWDELLGLKRSGWGQFFLINSRIVVIYSLPCNGYCRREYADQFGRVYSNDSGTVGMTFAKGVEGTLEDWAMPLKRLAHIVHYTTQFDCEPVVETIGLDCEIALIRMGRFVFFNTDDQSDESSSEQNEESNFRKIRRVHLRRWCVRGRWL